MTNRGEQSVLGAGLNCRNISPIGKWCASQGHGCPLGCAHRRKTVVCAAMDKWPGVLGMSMILAKKIGSALTVCRKWKAHNKHSHGRQWIGLALLAIIAGIGGESSAATASWTAVDDPELQGYYLYIAAGSCAYPGEFALLQSYGLVTSGDVPVPQIDGTYCYQLTAHNAAGESAPSNRVELTYRPVSQCPDVSYCKTLRGQARKQCLACK